MALRSFRDCGEVGMMKQRKIWILLLFLLALMACNRDPKVQAQRFLENGNKFFAREKFKEAPSCTARRFKRICAMARRIIASA